MSWPSKFRRAKLKSMPPLIKRRSSNQTGSLCLAHLRTPKHVQEEGQARAQVLFIVNSCSCRGAKKRSTAYPNLNLLGVLHTWFKGPLTNNASNKQNTHTHKQTNTSTNKQQMINTHTHTCTKFQANKSANKQTHKKQASQQASKQASKQNKQTHKHTNSKTTVDDRNPACPKICYTTRLPTVLVCEIMQDIYHQQKDSRVFAAGEAWVQAKLAAKDVNSAELVRLSFHERYCYMSVSINWEGSFSWVSS